MGDDGSHELPGSAYRGVAFCHVPADEPIRLEKLVSSDGTNDRWNRPGDPTLYLATEIPIAVAEMARHLDLGDGPVRRRLLGLTLDVDRLVDLRRAEVRSAVGGPERVEELRDREVARDLATRLRAGGGWRGLLVPSMAFLDDPGRGNLVLFVERQPGGIDALVEAQHEAGLIELRPTGG